MQWTLALYPSQAAVYGATVAVHGVPGAVAAYVPAVRHACPLADQPGEDYCRAYCERRLRWICIWALYDLSGWRAPKPKSSINQLDIC